MTAVPFFWWSLPHDGGRLVELDASECRELIRSRPVGRLAYETQRGPRVVPMNYVIAGNHVVWRTAPDSEPARCSRDQMVAFEVDQTDELQHTGWSVLIVGVAQEVPLEVLESLDVAHTPHPWPEEMRALLLHLPLTEITGRAVRATW